MPCANPHAASYRQRGGLTVAIAVLGCAGALAACGGSSSSSPIGATTATGYASPFGLSKCMRDHGVSNFPDPTNGPGGAGFNGIGRTIGNTSLIVDGITFSGPVVQSAEKACSKYLTPSGPPPTLSASQKQREVQFAACMRSHGISSFPDPKFPRSGGIEIQGGPGLDELCHGSGTICGG
jgi:hypothetical protein